MFGTSSNDRVSEAIFVRRSAALRGLMHVIPSVLVLYRHTYLRVRLSAHTAGECGSEKREKEIKNKRITAKTVIIGEAESGTEGEKRDEDDAAADEKMHYSIGKVGYIDSSPDIEIPYWFRL